MEDSLDEDDRVGDGGRKTVKTGRYRISEANSVVSSVVNNQQITTNTQWQCHSGRNSNHDNNNFRFNKSKKFTENFNNDLWNSGLKPVMSGSSSIVHNQIPNNDIWDIEMEEVSHKRNSVQSHIANLFRHSNNGATNNNNSLNVFDDSRVSDDIAVDGPMKKKRKIKFRDDCDVSMLHESMKALSNSNGNNSDGECGYPTDPRSTFGMNSNQINRFNRNFIPITTTTNSRTRSSSLDLNRFLETQREKMEIISPTDSPFRSTIFSQNQHEMERMGNEANEINQSVNEEVTRISKNRRRSRKRKSRKKSKLKKNQSTSRDPSQPIKKRRRRGFLDNYALGVDPARIRLDIPQLTLNRRSKSKAATAINKIFQPNKSNKSQNTKLSENKKREKSSSVQSNRIESTTIKTTTTTTTIVTPNVNNRMNNRILFKDDPKVDCLWDIYHLDLEPGMAIYDSFITNSRQLLEKALNESIRLSTEFPSDGKMTLFNEDSRFRKDQMRLDIRRVDMVERFIRAEVVRREIIIIFLQHPIFIRISNYNLPLNVNEELFGGVCAYLLGFMSIHDLELQITPLVVYAPWLNDILIALDPRLSRTHDVDKLIKFPIIPEKIVRSSSDVKCSIPPELEIDVADQQMLFDSRQWVKPTRFCPKNNNDFEIRITDHLATVQQNYTISQNCYKMLLAVINEVKRHSRHDFVPNSIHYNTIVIFFSIPAQQFVKIINTFPMPLLHHLQKKFNQYLVLLESIIHMNGEDEDVPMVSVDVEESVSTNNSNNQQQINSSQNTITTTETTITTPSKSRKKRGRKRRRNGNNLNTNDNNNVSSTNNSIDRGNKPLNSHESTVTKRFGESERKIQPITTTTSHRNDMAMDESQNKQYTNFVENIKIIFDELTPPLSPDEIYFTFQQLQIAAKNMETRHPLNGRDAILRIIRTSTFLNRIENNSQSPAEHIELLKKTFLSETFLKLMNDNFELFLCMDDANLIYADTSMTVYSDLEIETSPVPHKRQKRRHFVPATVLDSLLTEIVEASEWPVEIRHLHDCPVEKKQPRKRQASDGNWDHLV
ncbi:hypothetical protein SNEBB_007395 [Seison nebaliae]|nr:hypothetical protein SNEBB_007395 [Seison nebaliae]